MVLIGATRWCGGAAAKWVGRTKLADRGSMNFEGFASPTSLKCCLGRKIGGGSFEVMMEHLRRTLTFPEL